MKRETRSLNMSRQLKSSFFALTSFLVFVCVLLSLVPLKLLNQYLGKDVATIVQRNLLQPYKQIETFLPDDFRPYFLFIGLFVGLLLFVISRVINRLKPTLTKKQMKQLAERREFLQNHVKNKKKKLYDEYLKQSVIDYGAEQ